MPRPYTPIPKVISVTGVLISTMWNTTAKALINNLKSFFFLKMSRTA